MSEIEKFDPSKLMNGVRDRVKATFVSLIPDDQWEQMIQKESDNFFAQDNHYNSHEYKSNFQFVCREAMSQVAAKKVHEFFEKYHSNVFEGNSNLPNTSDLLKDLMIKNAPDIFVATFSNMFQKAINEIKNRNY